MQAARFALQRVATRAAVSRVQTRQMSGAVSHEEEVKEMWKWRYITIAAIPVCVGVAIWDLSHAHEHEHDTPQYPYMHIRTKDFPWGPCTLFDKHCWAEHKGEHAEE